MNESIFFQRTNKKEYHQIYITPQEYEVLGSKVENHSTADKLDKCVAVGDNERPIIENGCLKIELEKNHTFTNYETVLNNEQGRLSREGEKAMLEVQEWLLKNFEVNGVKIKDLNQINTFLRLPEEREKYISDPNILEKINKIFGAKYITNPRLEDITFLINSRLNPDWDYQDTCKLPKSLILKFWDYIEKENTGWDTIPTIYDESEEEEDLGESSNQDSAPDSTTLNVNSTESTEKKEKQLSVSSNK